MMCKMQKILHFFPLNTGLASSHLKQCYLIHNQPKPLKNVPNLNSKRHSRNCRYTKACYKPKLKFSFFEATKIQHSTSLLNLNLLANLSIIGKIHNGLNNVKAFCLTETIQVQRAGLLDAYSYLTFLYSASINCSFTRKSCPTSDKDPDAIRLRSCNCVRQSSVLMGGRNLSSIAFLRGDSYIYPLLVDFRESFVLDPAKQQLNTSPFL